MNTGEENTANTFMIMQVVAVLGGMLLGIFLSFVIFILSRRCRFNVRKCVEPEVEFLGKDTCSAEVIVKDNQGHPSSKSDRHVQVANVSSCTNTTESSTRCNVETAHSSKSEHESVYNHLNENNEASMTDDHYDYAPGTSLQMTAESDYSQLNVGGRDDIVLHQEDEYAYAEKMSERKLQVSQK